MSFRVVQSAVASLLFVGVSAATHARQDSAFRFGAFRVQIDGLDLPTAVGVGPNSRIFVVESGGDRVSVFDADGERIGGFGQPGNADAEFMRPSGIAIDAAGRIYVADTGNDRVQVFDPSFEHILTFGERGAAIGQFNTPRGIAVSGGLIYVADSGNDRVQVLDSTGECVQVIGASGRGDGQFNDPVDVAAVDTRIAVADSANNRIQVFSRDGTFVRSWGDWGPFPGLFDMPAGMASVGDELLVVDRRNHRVQAFDDRGNQQWSWGVHALVLREGQGKLHYPDDVAIAIDGSFAVICESFEDRIQVFDRATGDEPPTRGSTAPQTHFGKWVDAGRGYLVIGEPEGHFIYIFDTTTRTPTIVSQFGRRGWNHGQFIRISGIALDSSRDEVYVADEARGVIMRLRISPQEGELKFDPFRVVLVQEFDLHTLTGRDMRPRPGAITRTQDGETYVIDQRSRDVLRFDSSMDHVGSFRSVEGPRDPLAMPTDITTGVNDESILVTDADAASVFTFDRGGRWQPQQTIQSPSGQSWRPSGIAVGDDGTRFVVDERGTVIRLPIATERERALVTDGESIQWGEKGSDHEQFWHPAGVTIDESGRIYLVDYGNHRCQVFDSSGQWLMTFGSGGSVTRIDRYGDE